MQHIKYIDDPLLLERQEIVSVPEHQVPGLLPHIRAMVIMARNKNLQAITAPQCGLNFRFFVAGHVNQTRNPDGDTLFDPSYEGIEDEDAGGGVVTVEEQTIDGHPIRVARYKKIRFKWKYHNGDAFEEQEAEVEGHMAYLAQSMTDRLDGHYLKAEVAQQ